MWPYIFCFIITLFFANKNEQALKSCEAKKSSRVLAIITGAITVLLPAILAGCRDFRVGTDVQVYALQTFDSVRYANRFWDLFVVGSQYQESSLEIGYQIIAYISNLLSDDPHIFLFFISLFIGVFVYLTLYRMRRICSMFMGQVVYLFCCYNETLNMMRQCMAMVMILYALTFLLENKSYVKCFSIFAASYFFHHSALIGLALLLPILLLTREKNQYQSKKQMRWVLFMAIAFSFIMANFFSLAGYFISTNELFAERYDHYLTDTQNTGSLGNRLTFYYFIVYFLLYLDRQKMKYGYVFLTFAILDFVFYFLRMKQVYLYRISDYFFYCRIIGLSIVPVYALNDIQRYKLFKYGKIFVLFLFWLLYFGGEAYLGGRATSKRMGGTHQTMPYISDILK